MWEIHTSKLCAYDEKQRLASLSKIVPSINERGQTENEHFDMDGARVVYYPMADDSFKIVETRWPR